MTESELIERASRKRVLFSGESIVDQYIYVRPQGRPSKDPVISVERLHDQSFPGGVDAAAMHAQCICPNIEVITGGIAYRKTRFVEHTHLRKMFEFYEVVRPQAPEPHLLPASLLAQYDAVVMLDYGHGMFNEGDIERWSSNYNAVNVQTNSGNYGYNLATKYHGVDYMCVDETEARLATRNRDGPILDSLKALGLLNAKTVVTLGKGGAVGIDRSGTVTFCPAFTDQVVDTIGAGDAFFAVTALVAEEADMLSLLRIGNAAGALKAGIVGHTRGITLDELTGLLGSIPRAAA